MFMKNADTNNMKGVHAYLQQKNPNKQKQKGITFPVPMHSVSENWYPGC